MGKFKNYYNIIGLNPSEVSPETVKKAFRARLMEIRPDVNLGLETRAMFEDLQEARNVLGDPLKNYLYQRAFDTWFYGLMFRGIAAQVNSLEKQAERIVREAGNLR